MVASLAVKQIPVRWWAEREPNDVIAVHASTPHGDTAEMKFNGWDPSHFDSYEKRVKFMDLMVRIMGGTLYHKTQQRMEREALGLDKKPRPVAGEATSTPKR